jgi:hypothetical protein
MVQICDHGYGEGSKDWWTLDSGKQRGKKEILQIFKDRNYFHKSKSKDIDHLRALYIRCQRGLMSYEGVPIRELKLYLIQRGLPVIDMDKKVTLTGLKAQLEQADEDVTFRLSDLPPELRNIIFSYYFDSVVDVRYAPLKHQPPISQVSRIIRRETLPLFFGRFAFIFTFSRYPTQPAADTERYLSRTSAHNFAFIRRFAMCIDLDRVLTVIFHNDNNFSFEITPPWNKRGEDHSVTRERSSAAVESMLKEIATRGEARSLRTADIKALWNMLDW